MTVSKSDKPLPTVLITGCSDGGIGSALAEAFHDRGFHVFATARSLPKMAHLEKLENKTLLELDVESQSSIDAALEAVVKHTGGEGKLDYLVNNAGLNLNYPALDTDLAYAKKMFDVNFWAMVHVTHTFMPLLIASKGTLVNNASLAGVLHVPWGSFYNASKAAVRMYSEVLRLEVAPLGVKVITVMTGIVATNMFSNAPHDALPENSYYKMANEEIAVLASGEKFVGTAMPPAVYAEGVVNDVLSGYSGMTWRGKIASMGWFIYSYFPTWLTDRGVGFGSGLEKL
ncbi:hypothetical protein ASPSYDRAFT_26545 [Aspergillus sydowii CBS 593.65]|uniref:Uncharacterized protein n=1 Tax=Aspergillus sydowii CBS 593.65 TaxID=1036612 RepID=A0A1L9TYP2_9EURO|nr:uncharacterized protein ASPSYDRAFT_26545 [Aspergillus sydowii CBS 593.65]OJJ64554.1 hypothetical protein ASPSYDRAFT_26545 [Aspergillus sydowii CBS 593.65]